MRDSLLEYPHQSDAEPSRYVRESRRQPRFALEVPLEIYPRNCRVVDGYTVDISESGMAAILKREVPLGEVVRLEFTLPLGAVEIYALVCQRSAFRYGFKFVESASAHDLIGQTCRQLAVEQATHLRETL